MRLFRREDPRKARVEDLKARVESLRKADQAGRALTLNDFLTGDDVVAAREPLPEPPAPAHSDPPAGSEEDVMLAALAQLSQHPASPKEETAFEQPQDREPEGPGMARVRLEDFADTAADESQASYDEPPAIRRADDEDLARALAQYMESLKQASEESSADEAEHGDGELRNTI